MEEIYLKQKKERNIIEIFFIIIVIILLLFLIIEKIGKLNNYIPTGYVDVFDLHFENNTNKYIDINVEEKDNKNDLKTKINNVVIHDNEVEYKENEINIFKHAEYHILQDKIAPTSSNSYKFVVRNGNSFNVKYNLVMKEENKYNINMRYRLKLKGKYIIGDKHNWVTAQELKQYNVLLAENSNDTYTLEWYWFEGENDTEIGTNIEADYKLYISMYAEQY